MPIIEISNERVLRVRYFDSGGANTLNPETGLYSLSCFSLSDLAQQLVYATEMISRSRRALSKQEHKELVPLWPK